MIFVLPGVYGIPAPPKATKQAAEAYEDFIRNPADATTDIPSVGSISHYGGAVGAAAGTAGSYKLLKALQKLMPSSAGPGIDAVPVMQNLSMGDRMKLFQSISPSRLERLGRHFFGSSVGNQATNAVEQGYRMPSILKKLLLEKVFGTGTKPVRSKDTLAAMLERRTHPGLTRAVADRSARAIMATKPPGATGLLSTFKRMPKAGKGITLALPIITALLGYAGLKGLE